MTIANLGRDLVRMRAEMLSRVARARAAVRRTTPGPALVRCALYLAGVVAIGTAWPADLVLGRGLIVAVVVLALLPALLPRGIMPTLVIVLAIAGWLVATTSYAQPLTYARLVVVAGALYLVHTLAALAAVLPYDAVVSAGLLGRWFLRAALVVVLTAALALVAVVVPGALGSGGYLVASLAGLGLVAGLAAYLASLARHR